MFRLVSRLSQKPHPMHKLVEKNYMSFQWIRGFPHSSVGKESACNAGDPSSIPGLRRSPGDGIGYSLQYSGLDKSMGSQRVGHD